MNAMAHLGMRWTGAGHRSDGRKVLIAENLDSHRRWSIDPVTGIGEPISEVVPSRTESTAPQLEPAPWMVPPSPSKAVTSTAPTQPRRGGSPGPSVCEHCGAKSVYQIRFSQNEFVTKCLSCKRFVVDGRVERPGREQRARARRGASLWLPLE